MQKQIYLLITALALLLSSPLAAQNEEQEQYTFTLDECISYAYQNTAPVADAILDTKIADSRVGQAISTGLPQINGNANFQYNYLIQQNFLPAVFFADDPINNPPPDDAPPVAVAFGTKYGGNAAIQLQQLAFDGTFFLGLKAARVYKSLAERRLNYTKEQTAASIAKAYYGVLVNQEREELIDQNVARLDTLLRQTRARYAEGFIERIDVQRIEVLFNNVKTEQSKVGRLIELSKQVLKYQMGMPLNYELTLQDRLADISMPLPADSDNGFTYNQRIDYRLINKQLELEDLNIRQFQVRYFPSVYLNGTYGQNTGANNFNELDQWFGFGSIGLSVSVPIFDGFRKRHQIAEARALKDKVIVQKLELERRIDLERSQSAIELRNALDDLQNQIENRALAKRVYEVTQIKYNEGVGDMLEVTEAETAYKEAETNYYQAVYNALIAQVDYELSRGTLVTGVE
jgi:outer membrane protein TolC